MLSYGVSVYFMLFYNFLYRLKFPGHAPPYADLLDGIPLVGLLLYFRKNLVIYGYLYSATRSMVSEWLWMVSYCLCCHAEI